MRSGINAVLKNAGLVAEIISIRTGDRLDQTISSAIQQNPGTLVAAGGDGTVSAVAAQVAGTETNMGVLPLGTLNHFAKDLRIPLELEAAVHVLAARHVAAVDAAEVNGRVFINNSSLGIYPHIVARREKQQERLGKWPAFLWAALLAFRRFPFLHLRVCVEGEELERKTAFLFVGNNEYEIAGFRIGARARLDRGRLGLHLTHRTGRFGLLRLALRAILGGLRQAKDFETFSVENATIETRRRSVLVATDGEVTSMQPPLHYRSRPGALRVIVPK